MNSGSQAGKSDRSDTHHADDQKDIVQHAGADPTRKDVSMGSQAGRAKRMTGGSTDLLEQKPASLGGMADKADRNGVQGGNYQKYIQPYATDYQTYMAQHPSVFPVSGSSGIQ